MPICCICCHFALWFTFETSNNWLEHERNKLSFLLCRFRFVTYRSFRSLLCIYKKSQLCFLLLDFHFLFHLVSSTSILQVNKTLCVLRRWLIEASIGMVFQVCFWERRKLQLIAACASKPVVVRYFWLHEVWARLGCPRKERNAFVTWANSIFQALKRVRIW